jgi:hypothetical protein
MEAGGAARGRQYGYRQRDQKDQYGAGELHGQGWMPKIADFPATWSSANLATF